MASADPQQNATVNYATVSYGQQVSWAYAVALWLLRLEDA